MVDMWANFASFRDPTPKQKNTFVGDSLKGLPTAWPPSKMEETEFGRMPTFVSLKAEDDFEIEEEDGLRRWRERVAFLEEAAAKVKF